MTNLSEQAKKNQYASQRRIHESTLDRITVFVKKGQRDVYKKFAESKGISLNRLFVGAVNNLMKGDENHKTD